MATTPEQRRVLNNLGRPGWEVTSVRLPLELIDGPPDPATGKPTKVNKYPDGAEEWVISDGKGHNQTLVVKPPSTPVGSSVQWPTDQQGNPTVPAGAGQTQVLEPPKDMPSQSTPAQTQGGPLTDFQPIPGPNGQPAKLYNPNTGQVIDLPDTPATTQRPQVVGSENGGYYAWDGTTLKPLTQGKPDKPQIVQGERGALYSWDGTNLTVQRQPDAPQRRTTSIGNKIIDTDTGGVVYEDTSNQWTFHDNPDGSIIAINNRNPDDQHEVRPPQTKPPTMVAGQSVNQGQFLFIDPATGQLTAQPNPIAGEQRPQTSIVNGQQGPTILQQITQPDGSVTYQSVPNPAYTSAGQQALQEYLDGINQIEGMMTSGKLTVQDANRYKTLLRQQYDAKLRGTTPYQIEQDQMVRDQNRARMGLDALNQRISSGTGLASSLLNTAFNIASNPHMMDPSAFSGLHIFGDANNVQDFINNLGGGQGTLDAATQAVQQGLTGGRGSSAAADALMNSAGVGNGAALPASMAGAGSNSVMFDPAIAASLRNIGSGAASNPQPPTNGLVAPLGRQPETAAQSIQRNHLPVMPNMGGDPGLTPASIDYQGDPTGLTPVPIDAPAFFFLRRALTGV